jgi:hypothetical protein
LSDETTETTEATEPTPTKKSTELFQPTATTPTAPPGMLTRPSDIPVRPGFRSPSNKNSKAQKKRK